MPPSLDLKLDGGLVHRYPFRASVIEFSTSLRNENSEHITKHNVPLNLYMDYEDQTDPTPYHAYQILNPEALVINEKTGTSPIIRIQMLQCTGNQKVVLKISPVGDQNSHISPVSSIPMRVVNHRLEIYNESTIDALWFKDGIGGKNNQITLEVRLVNSQGKMASSRNRLCLQLKLYYEDGSLVKDQKILKIKPGQNMFLRPDGYATIRCRIESVSNKHGHKSFAIEVCPDTTHDPSVNDISPARTPCILVKSKISTENMEKKVLKQQALEAKSHKRINDLLPAGSKRKAQSSAHAVTPIKSYPPNSSSRFSACTIAAHNNFNGFVQFAEDTIRSLRQLKAKLDDPELIADIDRIQSKYNVLCNHTSSDSGGSLYSSMYSSIAPTFSAVDMGFLEPLPLHLLEPDSTSSSHSTSTGFSNISGIAGLGRLERSVSGGDSSDFVRKLDMSSSSSKEKAKCGSTLGPMPSREKTQMMTIYDDMDFELNPEQNLHFNL